MTTSLPKSYLNQTVYTMFVDPQIVDEKSKYIKTIREVAGGNTVEKFAGCLIKQTPATR